jgi:uncharacterized protein (TIGR03083 family)
VNAVPHPSAPAGLVEDYAFAAERFAVAVGWSDPRAPVPSCPGWSVYDLVVHLGNVHAWAATIVETGQRAAQHNDEPRSSKARSVSEWYLAKAEDLFQVLRQTPSQTPCWNFAAGSGGAGFWKRRQLHETTIHQVDLDLAGGRTTELSPAVAADGVDEVLTVMMPMMVRRGHAVSLHAPLLLTASDTGDRWLVAPPTGSPSVPEQQTGDRATEPRPPTVEHGIEDHMSARAGDLLEAPADRLYRAMWHRQADQGAVHVGGEEAHVKAFLASRLTP